MQQTTESQFVGTWEGTMEQPGFRPFPVIIRLTEFQYGKWSGILQHPPPLDADGRLLGIELGDNTMVLAATIFRGRERCLDGLSILRLLDENTMERVWVDPSTGEEGAKGRLLRVAT